jgi:hypothetical protein
MVREAMVVKDYDDLPREPVRSADPVESAGGVLRQGSALPVPPDDEGRDIDLGEDLDPELWGVQRALIEEDLKGGIKLEGFDEDVIPRILNALGDDAADPLQDFPGGTSATGSVNTPDHGGFPERD